MTKGRRNLWRFGGLLLVVVALLGGVLIGLRWGGGERETAVIVPPEIILPEDQPELFGESDVVEGQAFRESPLADGGEALRLDLVESEPEEVEENPLFFVAMAISEAGTNGQKGIRGDVVVYWRPERSTMADFQQLATACQQQTACRFAVPGRYNEVFYRVAVRAAGYEVWQRDFRVNTFKTRTIKMGVELTPTGPQALWLPVLRQRL